MDIGHEALNNIGKPVINSKPEIAKKIKFELGSAIDTLGKCISQY
jgi:hypothetical protein